MATTTLKFKTAQGHGTGLTAKAYNRTSPFGLATNGTSSASTALGNGGRYTVTFTDLATGVYDLEITTAANAIVAQGILDHTDTAGLVEEPASLNMSAVANKTATVNLSGTSVKLTSDGLDNVLVEQGISASSSLTNDSGTQLTSINVRQAFALFLSTLAGALSGVATNALTFKPGGKPAGNTRVAATQGSDGRSSVTLKVPD